MSVYLSKLNFRDLGGTPVADGRRVRQGILYRSQGPKRLTADHKRELDALGLRLICDLRSRREYTEDSYQWDPAVQIMHCEIADDFGSANGTGRAMLRDNPSELGVVTAMCSSYALMPSALSPYLRGLVEGISANQLPLLIHCTAGKDRTGVAVSLLLLLLGATRDVAIADYMLSACYAEALREQGVLAQLPGHYGIPLDYRGVDALVGVRADYLLSALDRVEEQWGSVATFFVDAGVDLARQAHLRSVLTEPA